MPAQREEVEAAEREGIVIRPATGLTAVVGHDGPRGGRADRSRRPADGAAPTWETGSRLAGSETSIASLDGPRRHRRGAGSVDPARRAPGSGSARWAGIVADPRSLATGRAGVFAGGDVVSGAKTVIDAVAAGRRAAGSIHEFLAGVPNGEAAIFAAARVADARRADSRSDLRTQPRAAPPLPVLSHGSFGATQSRLRRGCRPAGGPALLPLRRHGCLPDGARARWPGASRPAVAPVVTPAPPALRPADRAASAGSACPDHQQPHRGGMPMTPDQVAGFFDAGETFIEGTIAAALVVLWMLVIALHSRGRTWSGGVHKFSLRLGADLWWIIFVALRDSCWSRCSSAASSSSTPTSSPVRICRITGSLAAVCAFAAC